MSTHRSFSDGILALAGAKNENETDTDDDLASLGSQEAAKLELQREKERINNTRSNSDSDTDSGQAPNEQAPNTTNRRATIKEEGKGEEEITIAGMPVPAPGGPACTKGDDESYHGEDGPLLVSNKRKRANKKNGECKKQPKQNNNETHD
ncbi:unknown protein [Seminavis robusta]|uniref:Uncharacterized protein n=1 Tax=Seminavis robusta TaxID=568900 RepID=A0A9N8EJ23_9STRA|nr:unknown protein [Seminavis robusta]|eukprot:Sro1219_g253470.1 n/a (150) ;mRNA; r:32673-33122